MSLKFNADLESVYGYFSPGVGQGSLIIPAYQRRYEWRGDECDALFSDIISHISDNKITFQNIEQRVQDGNAYLLGSVILLISPQGRSIIDGQQRTTTLTLLSRAISIKIHEIQTPNNELINARNLLLNHLAAICQNVVALNLLNPTPNLQVNYGELTYREIVLGVENAIVENDLAGRRYKENYSTFLSLIDRDLVENSQQIANQNDAKLKRLLTIAYVLAHGVKLLVLKAVTTLPGMMADDEAITIFSTLNTRGLDLSLSDKIKAGLFSKLIDKTRASEEWDDLFSELPLEDIDSHCVSFISAEQKDFPKSALSAWSHKIDALNPAPGEDNSFNFYRRFLDSHREFSGSRDINPIVRMLELLSFGEWKAVLLSLSIDGNDQYNIKLLWQACFCFCVTGVYEKSRKAYLRKIFWNQGYDNYSYENLRNLTIEKLEAFDVYSLPAPKRNFFIKTVERLLVNGDFNGYGDYHIEHVLPQKYDLWLGDGVWTEDLAKSVVHKIGNLIILPRKINSAISNLPFDKKIRRIEEKLIETNEQHTLGVFGLRLAINSLNPPVEWSPSLVIERQLFINGRIRGWLNS